MKEYGVCEMISVSECNILHEHLIISSSRASAFSCFAKQAVIWMGATFSHVYDQVPTFRLEENVQCVSVI